MYPISNQRNLKYKFLLIIYIKENLTSIHSQVLRTLCKIFQHSHMGTFMLIAMQIPWAFSF